MKLEWVQCDCTSLTTTGTINVYVQIVIHSKTAHFLKKLTKIMLSTALVSAKLLLVDCH